MDRSPSMRVLGDLGFATGSVPPQFRDLAVTALCSDSRAAAAGTLFFAVTGQRHDGHQYALQAAHQGAVAVVSERPLEGLPSTVPVILVPDVREQKARAAHAFHGWPSRSLRCVGVTGTNGKTTTATMLHSVMSVEGLRPTFVGTTGCLLDQERRPSTHTTPDALDLAALLAETRDRGGHAAVLEVSSHALTQHRVTGVEFDAAIFTQLSREHLDYHQDVLQYRRAKCRLFENLDRHAIAVLNAEDPCSMEYLRRTPARVLTYGMTPGADVTATVRRMDIDGLAFDLHFRGQCIDVTTRLIGRHNLMNALAAAAAALALDVSASSIQGGFELLRRVPGRLEPVDRGQDFRVLVDYAHTDDALEKVLSHLRPLTRGRILTVFGCGGNRDRTKRPRMGRVVASLSNDVFLTSDNPRSEDPQAIADEVLKGIPRRDDVHIILDRREAIRAALSQARGGDIVLIAGKGHETEQVVGDQSLPFDDRKVAEEVLWQLSS